MRNGFEQDSKNLFTWGIYDMKNTLYVSDLDGTLFNSSKKISERTVQIFEPLYCKRNEIRGGDRQNALWL